MTECQNAEENCAFPQYGPCRKYPTYGYPKISEGTACTCSTN